MRTVEVARVALNTKEYAGRAPRRNEFDETISTDFILTSGGAPVLVYKVIPAELLANFRHYVKTCKFTKSVRVRGVATKSAVFGSLPRIPSNNNFCRASAQTTKQPEHAGAAFGMAQFIDSVYAELLPLQRAQNMELINGSVESEWLITGTPFATVNFNVNHAIKYHKDTGNFKNVYSNVLIMREGTEGGELVLPEFRIALKQQDGALTLFDGQNILHGVMPLRGMQNGGYRCSCVFYALENMKHCYPYKQELEYAKKWRDKVESRFRPPPQSLGLKPSN